MKYKKIIMLTIILAFLLAISVVSAQDNATNDIVSVEQTNDEAMLFNNKSVGELEEGSDYVVGNEESADSLKEDVINAKIEVINSENQFMNGAFKFKVTDIDNPNTSLEGKKISLYTGGDSKAGFSAFIDENNTASFKTSNLYEVYSTDNNFDMRALTVGKHAVEVSTNGNVNATPIIVNLTITKADININIGEFKEKYGTNKNLTITVTNKKDGAPVPKIILHLYMPQTIEKNYYFETNSEGICQIILDQLMAGTYSITITNNDTNNINKVSSTKKVVITNPIVKINILNTNLNYKNSKFIIRITDKQGKGISNVKTSVKFDNKKNFLFTSGKNGYISFTTYISPGNHILTINVVDTKYSASPLSKKIFISKGSVSITAIKNSCIVGNQITLKAIVKDKYGKVDEGTVKFTINGKNYNVKVHNGVAQKKIKLTEIKTYTYKAKFISKNYIPKTAVSKVMVKKIPTFIIKIGKYSVKINYNDYKKIKKAENSGHFIKKYDTGKTINYKVYADKKITDTKKKLYSYGTYTTYYIPNSDALIAPSGYKYVGKQFTVENGIEKVYMIYKKTTYKKVLVKTPKTKVYISIEATPWHGAIAKLYHLQTVYDGSYRYYLGNQKSIF